MKMKKLLFGLLACVALMAVSCEPNSTAEEDQLYEQGIHKDKIKTSPNK